jgi:L-threonylcarbamoyladenylate synthase
MDGRIEMVVDGGEVGIGLESTIIDMTVTPPKILRPGYVTREMLEHVLGEIDMDVTIMRDDSGQTPKAPGMKYRHYAPAGRLTIVEGEPGQVTAYINERAAKDKAAGEKTGILGTREQIGQYQADVIKCMGNREDEERIARNLFSALRSFDEERVTRIYSESFPTQGLGQAIMNRLLKAAGHRVVRLDEAGERSMEQEQ